MTMSASDLLTEIRRLNTSMHRERDLAGEMETSGQSTQHYARADDLCSDLAAAFELLDEQLSGGCGQRIDWTESIVNYSPAEPTDELYPATRLVSHDVSETKFSDLDSLGTAGPLAYEDPAEDNATRAIWCLVGLRAFAQRTGITDEDPALVIGDFLGDLRHLCDALGVDFATVNDHGAEHHWYEVRGE